MPAEKDIDDSGWEQSHLDYVQWYKADGSPTSGKLPQDPYHVTKYTDRGWTRRPPVQFIQTEEE